MAGGAGAAEGSGAVAGAGAAIITYMPKLLVGATIFLFAFQTLWEWMYENVRGFQPIERPRQAPAGPRPPRKAAPVGEPPFQPG